MRTKRPGQTPRSESDTMRALQQIAKRGEQQKATTEGIQSSAHRLGDELNNLADQLYQVATTHHVTPSDILHWLAQRISAR